MKYLSINVYIVVNILTILLKISRILCTESPVTQTKSECNGDSLVDILADMQVINPESVIKLALIKNLEISCKQVREGLDRIDDYYQICKTTQTDNDLYYRLYKGLTVLKERVCQMSSFQQSFSLIHSCLHELKNDFEDCSGPADWNENPQENYICRVYKDICDCFYIKTAQVCGLEPANIMKQLIVEVFNEILTVKCDVENNPHVDNPMPEKYIRKNQANVLKSTLILTIITIISVHLTIN